MKLGDLTCSSCSKSVKYIEINTQNSILWVWYSSIDTRYRIIIMSPSLNNVSSMVVMGDTDTKVLDTMVPGPSRVVSNTRFGIESSRYRKPHPLNCNIL